MFTTLISAQNLARHQNDSNWVVFDCRHDLAKPDAGRATHRASHIPGAAFAHLGENLSGQKDPTSGRHPLPEREVWLEFLRAAGVHPSSQVIAYDASGGMFAARLWWLMRWVGHEAVAVLDGGLPAWERAGLPQSDAAAKSEAGTIVAGTPLVEVVGPEFVQTNLATRTHLLIDARASERYRGDIEPLDRAAGHIPGSVNHFYQHNLESEGRFLPGHALREQFRALIDPREASSIVHQCGSGVSACHNLLAMELAGLHGSALYPGSWSQWCSDPRRPITVGAAP